MKELYEIEPFAFAYLNADIDDAEYRIAVGMRELAKYITLIVDKNTFYPSFPVSLFPSVYYKFGRGIATFDNTLKAEKEKFPYAAKYDALGRNFAKKGIEAVTDEYIKSIASQFCNIINRG